MTENQNENEGHLLEMSNHFKELYEKLTSEKEKLQDENINLKKYLISVYGIVRVIDETLCFTVDSSPDTNILIEVLRGYLSEFMDEYVFNLS